MKGVCALVLAFLAVFVAGALAAGGRDPTFGTNGFTFADDPGGNQEVLNDVAVLPSGKILAVGSRGGSGGFLLLRLNADGSPDQGFGVGGIQVQPDTDMPGAPRALSGMDMQSDGRIVAAGLGRGPGGLNAFGFARYLSDGSIDSSFGDGGQGVKVVAAPPGYDFGDAFDVAAGTGDRTIGAGEVGDQSMGFFTFVAAALALDSSGQPDASFGSVGGFALIDVPGGTSEEANAIERMPDGSLLVGGRADDGAFLAKLDANGNLVPGFGTGGIAVHDLGTAASPSGFILDLEVTGDGKILATGSSAGPGSQLFVARFLPGGGIDPSFGNGGKVLRNPTPNDDEGAGLALTPDGRIVVAGVRNDNDDNSEAWVFRLLADGSPDPAFGPGGERVFDLTPGLDAANAVTLQGDGKAVIAGSATPGPGFQLMVGRLRGDPRAPTPASCLGKPATLVGTPNGEVLTGTGRRDVIAARGGRDRIRSFGGNDVICAGAGNDTVRGGKGRDRVKGGPGNDRLYGGPARDQLLGGTGKDRFGGGAGIDLCRGGSGRDAAAGCEVEPGVP